MIKKVDHRLTFSMLIDNPIGKECDPESDAVYPVTTISRKYNNKDDDVHKDIVFYSNGDVEFMENVSMYRYTQFDHLLYNFNGNHNIVTMIHYLQFLGMVTQYGIPTNKGAMMKYYQYAEEMKRAKFDNIEFEESAAEDSKNARYHISCHGVFTRSATNDAGVFNCKDIFEDKPVALLCFHHKNGIFGKMRKIYAYIFRDGRVVFHGKGPFRLNGNEFDFLLDILFKICDITYDNMDEDFKYLDEAYSEAIKEICRKYRDRSM